MPSKKAMKRMMNHKKNRKEFRKQQRELKKKSKRSAKEFGILYRQKGEKALKLDVKQNGENKLKKKQKKKVKSKGEQATTPNPTKPIPKGSDRDKNDIGKWNESKHRNSKKDAPQRMPKETDPEDKLIKHLEKKLGYNKGGRQEKYWKHQEFTQDGLDCFFDLEYFSGESDVEEETKEKYLEYYEFQDFLKRREGKDKDPVAAFKALQKTRKSNDPNQTKDTNDGASNDVTTEKVSEEKRKQQKRDRKEAIYGEGVHHSDDEDSDGDTAMNAKVTKDSSDAMNAFLEDGDNDSDSDSDSVQQPPADSQDNLQDDSQDNPQDDYNRNSNMISSEKVSVSEFDSDVKKKDEYGPPMTPDERKKENEEWWNQKTGKSDDSKSTKKYVPPQLRRLKLQRDDNGTGALERCIGGHLNRLGSTNLDDTSSMISGYFTDSNSKYSRTQITEALCQCIARMIDKEEESAALNSIILCLSGLVAITLKENGIRIGSNIVETLSTKYTKSDQQDFEDQFKSNLIRLFCGLYLFNVITSKYLIGMLIHFVEHCTISSFNALQIPMTLCGAALRNSEPIKFKDLILLICKTSAEFTQNGATPDDKEKWAMEETMNTVYDIKDNLNKMKTAKVQQSAAFRALRSSIGTISPLPMSFTDFLEIKRYGRWWLPGAPVKGGMMKSKRLQPVWKRKDSAFSFSEKLLKLSKQFHMNSPLRRAIFCIIMDSEDYIDAFGKVVALDTSDGRHTEVIRIILLLALRESAYNEYYGLLMAKLLDTFRDWRFSAKLAFWDRMNEIEDMKATDIANMAKLLCHVISGGYLTIGALRKIDILATTPKNMLFVHTVLEHLLMGANSADVFRLLWSKRMNGMRQDIEVFFGSVMMPRINQKVETLTTRHQAAQQLWKENQIERSVLTKIGLQLRKQEDMLLRIKSTMSIGRDVFVKESAYNQSIM